MPKAQAVFTGIDVGSLTAKSVLLNNEKIISYSIIETGDNPKQAGETVFENVLNECGYKKEDVRQVVGTGYGRVSLSFADRTITELSCHATGVHYLNPGIRTVIDMGGQDSKVITLNGDGTMAQFAMNDKCAAGTGRFLEVMAKALLIDLEALGKFSMDSGKPCDINNTCTVFAESEVVSLLAAGEHKADIVAGLHKGIATRVGNMVKRLGLRGDFAFVGGVAKNAGLKKALEEFLKIRFSSVDADPQIIGALGAALLARERYKKMTFEHAPMDV
ncbi:MAG: acyl-CoA dehydratase activase [Thermodesulfobacteriota bacterium]|nr:acyl-CoA dehydratase activase [Thermodesulfobacteriota bacterium]